MSPPGDRQFFSPLPNRALVDERLSGMDLRVLGVVAMHDRFGRNGMGCTTGTRAIAAKLGTYQPTVAKAVRRLEAAGYLARHPHPTHKQMYMLAVVYEPTADKAILTTKTDSPQIIGQVLEPIASEHSVGAETDSLGTINKRLTSKVTKNIRSKPKEGHSVETASSCIEAFSASNIGAALARIERAMNGVKPIPIRTLREWRDWIEAVHETLECGDPNHGRAFRLLVEREWPADDVAVNR